MLPRGLSGRVGNPGKVEGKREEAGAEEGEADGDGDLARVREWEEADWETARGAVKDEFGSGLVGEEVFAEEVFGEVAGVGDGAGGGERVCFCVSGEEVGEVGGGGEGGPGFGD